MRSMRVALSLRIESSIWRMPAVLPDVHTLVARKSVDWTPSLAARSPTTSSERPYIGEESTTEPPSSTKAPRTPSSPARALGATSNVCHVPRPMAGSASPVDGIGRVRRALSGPDPAAFAR